MCFECPRDIRRSRPRPLADGSHSWVGRQRCCQPTAGIWTLARPIGRRSRMAPAIPCGTTRCVSEQVATFLFPRIHPVFRDRRLLSPESPGRVYQDQPGRLSRCLCLDTPLSHHFARFGFFQTAPGAVRLRARPHGRPFISLWIHLTQMDQFGSKLSERRRWTDSRKRSIDVLIDNFKKRNKVRKKQLNFHDLCSCERNGNHSSGRSGLQFERQRSSPCTSCYE